MTKEQRARRLVLAEPVAPNAKRSQCKWCGKKIIYTSLATARHRTRRYHRGDKFEKANGKRKRNCRREFRESMVWNARDALRWHSFREYGRVELHCVDCATLVETSKTLSKISRHEHVKWEADHDIALIDGGLHDLENFRVRCVSCHRDKTKKERQRRRL